MVTPFFLILLSQIQKNPRNHSSNSSSKTIKKNNNRWKEGDPLCHLDLLFQKKNLFRPKGEGHPLLNELNGKIRYLEK